MIVMTLARRRNRLGVEMDVLGLVAGKVHERLEQFGHGAPVLAAGVEGLEHDGQHLHTLQQHGLGAWSQPVEMSQLGGVWPTTQQRPTRPINIFENCEGGEMAGRES